MLLDALKTLIFSNNKKQEYVKSNLYRLWDELMIEYGLSTELILTNIKEYPNEVARRLATLGINTVPEKLDWYCSKNLTKPLMLTRYTYISEYGVIVPRCVGVFCMFDLLCEHFRFDSETEIDRKFKSVEYLLRHEIGHVLSLDVMYRGLTNAKASYLSDTLNKLECEKKDNWKKIRTIEEQLKDYFDLPLEYMANQCVNIETDEMVDAYKLLMH